VIEQAPGEAVERRRAWVKLSSVPGACQRPIKQAVEPSGPLVERGAVEPAIEVEALPAHAHSPPLFTL